MSKEEVTIRILEIVYRANPQIGSAEAAREVEGLLALFSQCSR